MWNFCDSADRFVRINRGVAVRPNQLGLAVADMRPLEVLDIIDVASDGTRMLEMLGMIRDDRSI